MTSSFLCPSLEACRGSAERQGNEFFKGQLSYVGRHYDLAVNRRPLRIVVVGQEYGKSMELVGLDQRYEMIHDDSGLGGFRARNPHMRGTTFALRMLLHGTLDTDDEWIEAGDQERFHMFDAFALVNVLLCSAVVPGKMKGRSTKEMQGNCLRHFVATLEVLDPTVIVLQGQSVRKWVAPAIRRSTTIAPALESVGIGSVQADLCAFNHPSTPTWNQGWANAGQPYLSTVVEPTLLLARQRALA